MNKNWQYKRIGDVCVVERGGSPRPIDQYITEDKNGINWIKIGDTTESMFITETAQKIKPEGMKKSRYVQPGDFLLSNSMSFGRPYILKIDGCIHDGWLVLRDNNELFDKRFLYYYLSSKTTYQKFKEMAVGGVVNNLNSDMVRKVDVPVPPKTEQEEIADLLDKLNAIVNMRQQELQKLDELVKSQFVEMFGDQDIEDTQWPCERMEEVFSITSSRRILKSEWKTEGSIPFIRVRDMVQLANKEPLSNEFYVTEEFYESRADDEKVQPGDVIVSATSTIGKTYIIKPEERFYFKDADVLLFRKKKPINEVFFSYGLTMPTMWKQIESGLGATTVAHFLISKASKLLQPLPPIDKQQEFARLVEQADKSKFVIQQSLNKTQLLFDSLMQKYFG